MRFEWNDGKASTNLAKHRLSFEFAIKVWDDPYCQIYPDRVEDGEERWHAVGLVSGVLLLLVVHSYPYGDDDDRVRIIGARRATREERRTYDQQIAGF